MSNIFKKYNKLINKAFENIDDIEAFHCIRDGIYENFITDISNGIFTNVKDIKKISNLINNKIIKEKVEVWYA